MALHSMCQPGRPGPQGESQAGSPGLLACRSEMGVLVQQSDTVVSGGLR